MFLSPMGVSWLESLLLLSLSLNEEYFVKRMYLMNSTTIPEDLQLILFICMKVGFLVTF